MSTNTFARAAAVTAVVATAMVATAATASAHITTDPSEITRGGYARVSFHVPNESKTAGTVKIELTLPQEAPLLFVQAEPKPGWTPKVTTGKLDKPVEVNNTTFTQAVRSVSWTAQPGTRIGPDEFGIFSLLVIAVNDTDELVIPATQTYDDGTVQEWNQPPADGEEPQSPAPVVRLTGSASDDHSHAGEEGGSEESGNADAAIAVGQDDSARWLGGGGLALGALALGIALGTLLRGRRPTRPATSPQTEHAPPVS